MKYHKFIPHGYDDTYSITIAKTATRLIIVNNDIKGWENRWRQFDNGEELPRKYYRELCNTTYFKHEVMNHDEFVLDNI